jgi:hypothetical protein
VRQAHPAAWLGVGLALFIGALLPSTALAQYTRLQVLLPGETAAPGTPTGKSGSPRAQVVGVPFSITVRACDNTWNTVTNNSNTIQITSSDVSATIPSPAQLSSGQRIFQITFNAAGNFTILAHDQSDNTIPDGTSSSVASQNLASFTFPTISQKHKYAGVAEPTTITARDPNGNVVTGYTGPVGLREITSFGDGRVSPEQVTLTNGVWSGNVTLYRADETSINRGNANMYAYAIDAPSKNGTSDPFIVHPGPFNRMQIVLPGQTPLPGSVAGLIGSPASQSVGSAFTVNVYATDAYWNPVPSGNTVTVVSGTDNSESVSPSSGALVNGTRQFSVTLNSTGAQTLTVSTGGGIQSMTSAPIQVIPAGVNGFAFDPIPPGVVAGTPITVRIRAVDTGGNTQPNYAADAILTSNTGVGSVTPNQITFANGEWTGQVTLFGAGGAVALTAADYSVPPKIGSSSSFVVSPGPFYRLQVILPGQTAAGGTASGKTGTPTNQTAGNPFNITVRAVDEWWNLIPGVTDLIGLTSTDTFAWMPADTNLVNGQVVIPVRLHKAGNQTITATDLDDSNIFPNTSSPVLISGGSFARVLVLAPGESVAPGTASGRTGTATDQNINYSFTLTVLATDQWWNPVGGATDVVRITSGDPMAQLPPNEAMVDGMAEMNMRLSTGGFQQITVSDVTNPARTGSTTQVRAITSGFHLEATINQATALAGAPFTVYIRVVNDAGSVIQEINSAVTLEVRNAGSGAPGRGILTPVTGQLTQGDWLFNADYTFAEAIQIIVRDDAGNAPATSNPITITPGVPTVLRLSSNPTWVGLNKHATLTARVEDAYANGVPGRTVGWSLLSGTGTITVPNDSTNAEGYAYADFLSPRTPETDRIRATSGSLSTELDLSVAYVDPAAAAGFVTSYPNPFHAGSGSTTIAYKLQELATVNLRIFTTSGSLVRHLTFPRGTPGGNQGLNEWIWDGKNGKGEVVSSGGYVAFIEAQGTGETLHVIKHKIAVVR